MSGIAVGNDVVDIERPRTVGRSNDDRFVRRILDEEEREAVRRAEDPDIELWARWAAKEAAFKVAAKLTGEAPLFAPAAFKVVWGPTSPSLLADGPSTIRLGSARRSGLTSHVRVSLRDGGVHAVAVATRDGRQVMPQVHPHVALLEAPTSPWSGSLDQLLSRLSAREAGGVRSQASAAVRVGAKSDLAKLLGVCESRVEIVRDPAPVGRRPPRVLVDGEEANADVSLSHDGRWIAWALLVDLRGKNP